LNHRAARAGYKIVFILYNGYTSSDALQEMQDSAIQSRTNLRLTAEIEKQNNELANLMLESEKKRFAMENELNQLKSTFEKRLDEARASFKLDMKKSEHAVDFQVKDFEATCERQLEQMKNKTDEEYLETLHHMKVDLNKYECELNRAKNKNDRVYEIVN
jgi:flagellar biosynthesis GTPase FlhF